MKYILLIVLFTACQQLYAQPKTDNKKELQRPKPVKDTAWITISSDTLYGTIEYDFGAGKISGEGMIVKDRFWHHSEYIYSHWDQLKIDSFHNAQKNKFGMWASDRGGISISTEDQKRAYIKTSKGYMIVSEQFTFKPK